MPACSTCGLFVEWLRSCYRSRWRVWTDTSATIRGRYYRVPHDARGVPQVDPFPGNTIYQSRTWWDRNFQLQQPELGERLSTKHVWDAGTPPVRVPNPIVAGDPDCITNGETIGSGLTLDNPNRRQSWPLLCVTNTPLQDWGQWSAIWRCEVQAFWADRMQEADTGLFGTCAAVLEQTFPGATVSRVEATVLFPPITIVRHPQYLIAMIQPTQNAEQALIEVLNGINDPTDMGGFSSETIWAQQGARALVSLSNAGGGLTEPLLLIGYSYGGAAAHCASAIARLANSVRSIRCLTFGSPRPGDRRLQNLCRGATVSIRLANNDDAFTAIPPQLGDLLPAMTVLGRDLRPFAEWQGIDETWVQDPNGSLTRNISPNLSTAELVALLELVWTTGTLFGYPAHRIQEYARRIRLRCPRAFGVAGGDIGLGFRLSPALALQSPVLPTGPLAFLAAELPDARSRVKLLALPASSGTLGMGAQLRFDCGNCPGGTFDYGHLLVTGVQDGTEPASALNGVWFMSRSAPCIWRTNNFSWRAGQQMFWNFNIGAVTARLVLNHVVGIPSQPFNFVLGGCNTDVENNSPAVVSTHWDFSAASLVWHPGP